MIENSPQSVVKAFWGELLFVPVLWWNAHLAPPLGELDAKRPERVRTPTKSKSTAIRCSFKRVVIVSLCALLDLRRSSPSPSSLRDATSPKVGGFGISGKFALPA